MEGYTLKAILGLVVFIVLMLGIRYFYKHLLLSGKTNLKKSRYMKSVDRLALSNDKWIEIIDVGKEKLVLGITQENISVLKTLDREELKEIEVSKNENLFTTALDKFTNKKNR